MVAGAIEARRSYRRKFAFSAGWWSDRHYVDMELGANQFGAGATPGGAQLGRNAMWDLPASVADSSDTSPNEVKVFSVVPRSAFTRCAGV